MVLKIPTMSQIQEATARKMEQESEKVWTTGYPIPSVQQIARTVHETSKHLEPERVMSGSKPLPPAIAVTGNKMPVRFRK